MGVEVNMQRGEIGSELQGPSLRGYEDTLRFLIWKRAEVNVQGRWYGSALKAESFEFHETVPQLVAQQEMKGNFSLETN